MEYFFPEFGEDGEEKEAKKASKWSPRAPKKDEWLDPRDFSVELSTIFRVHSLGLGRRTTVRELRVRSVNSVLDWSGSVSLLRLFRLRARG